jgi:very-short-patch-repair endonuclease
MKKGSHLTPEQLARLTERSRRLAKDPTWHATVTEFNRKMTRDPAVRAKMSATALKRAQDPVHKGDMLAMAQRRASNLGWRENVTAALRRRQSDPVFRANFMAGRRKLSKNPEYQAMMAARNRGLPNSPRWREKNRAHLDSVERPSKAERHIAVALEPLGFAFRGNQSAYRIAGRRPDFLDEPRKLIVESDGYWTHRKPKGIAADLALDTAREALGYRTLRLGPEVNHKTSLEEIRDRVGKWMAQGA